MNPQQIVAKLWSYCHVPRDTGVGTLDYVEQLTYLLFLKMAQEQFELTGSRVVPEGTDWPSLLALDGDQLETHYRRCSKRSERSLEHWAKSSRRPLTRFSSQPSSDVSSWTSLGRRTGQQWTRMSRATPTKACWLRASPTAAAKPASTSHHAHSLGQSLM